MKTTLVGCDLEIDVLPDAEQFRDGVRILLLGRGESSCHQRRRRIKKERRVYEKADLCSQVVRS